jgi:hypothetical protein
MSFAAAVRPLLLSGFAALAPALAGAATVTVNFDEFTSPPVTCCYDSTGVTGTLNYAAVHVDGGSSGAVMNGDGWVNAATSGANLYGSTGGVIELLFQQASGNVSLDVINGIEGAADYTVELRDATGGLLDSSTRSLAEFDGDANTTGVGHFAFSNIGVYSALIYGSSDFAIDTLVFETGAGGGLPPVPEPAPMLLMAAGAAVLVVAARRRREKFSAPAPGRRGYAR